MTRREFDRLVARVMEMLPEEFAPYLENLVVDVEDEADERTLREAGLTDDEIAAGETVYGLFVPFPDQPYEGLGGVDGFEQPMHKIVIYRRPLVEDFPHPEELRIEVRKTVVHELAHHFGFDERDLEKFEENPDPFLD
jgi:predicted Zn-dependent protease with MMP-like domain